MLQELKFQVSTAVLTLLTLASVVSAVINFQQQFRFRLPDDGITWVDEGASVKAWHVDRSGSGAKAGIHRGDVLVQINGLRIEEAAQVTQVLVGIGAWKRSTYLIEREGVEVTMPVIVAEAPQEPVLLYLYLVGGAYLGIGLFIYFRRSSAFKARHFYILCLTSFIFCTFHYTGKLNPFDKAVYWGNVAAGLFAPTIFLHFCLTFPLPAQRFRSKVGLALIYLPAAMLLGAFIAVASGALRVGIPLVELRWILDRIWLPFLTILYLLGALVLNWSHRETEDPAIRQQLKWLRNGTLSGVVPFAVLYVLPYSLGFAPTPAMKLSVLSLALMPLTLAYAIVRYRLMDVDVIFRRGYAYTLATLGVLGAFYGIVFFLGSLVQKNFKDVSNLGLISVMLIASFLFQPIRNWIQERLDKFFYSDRYDYRLTLIEFARELSSETDLERMLISVSERLRHTLSIEFVGFFLESSGGGFELHPASVLRDRSGRPIEDGHGLDLSFLPQEPQKPYLFFERTRYQLDLPSQQMPAAVRQTIASLDLTYYIPCKVRSRTIAYLGVSRTATGDFLSSLDVELLLTLSGYVGIAIENARLYLSLQSKMDEYERLKEFSENIVESVNVGILAVDLEDRVESWNAQMEKLTGISRDRAVGRRLGELFDGDLALEAMRVRGEAGVHHIWKHPLRPARGSAVAKAQNGNGNGNGHANGKHTDPHSQKTGEGEAQRTVNVAIAPLVSRENSQIGRLVIFDDVTDRTELERQLLQADKLSSIGLLAAGVAHEVNTPLAVISTYSQMLAKQVAQDEQKSKLLEKIAKQTFRASEIVNSLLNFSRTSTSEFSPVDLNRVIQETVSLLEHQLRKAGVETRVELEPGLNAIHGNAGKLQQVFLNLFLNARDAMEEGGSLAVRTWSEAEGARVSISDSGPGIPAEIIERIYDPFFTTKAAKKGTGLGLSVSYGIIREHGGRIEAASAPGAGTRFTLEFPWIKQHVRTSVNA